MGVAEGRDSPRPFDLYPLPRLDYRHNERGTPRLGAQLLSA